MHSAFRHSLLAAALLLAMGAPSHALSSWVLDLDAGANDWDEPRFLLTNSSTAGEEITDFRLGIGDPLHVFDAVLGSTGEVTTGATLLSPDRRQNNFWARGGRSSTLAWSFSDFQPGEQLAFRVDIDHRLALFGSEDDARNVFFDNDATLFGFPISVPNATVRVGFSDGSVRSLTLPDGFASSYRFSSGPPPTASATVPEPGAASLLMMGLGLAGLALAGGPRKPAKAAQSVRVRNQVGDSPEPKPTLS